MLVGRGPAGTAQGKEIAPGREFRHAVEMPVWRAGHDTARVIANCHAKRCCAISQSAPDPAQPDNAEPRPVDRTCERIFAGRPPARANEAVGTEKIARRRYDQAHRDIGDVAGQHMRRRSHFDAAHLRCFGVDAVRARAEARNDLQCRQAFQQGCADRRLSVRRQPLYGGELRWR